LARGWSAGQIARPDPSRSRAPRSGRLVAGCPASFVLAASYPASCTRGRGGEETEDEGLLAASRVAASQEQQDSRRHRTHEQPVASRVAGAREGGRHAAAGDSRWRTRR
jgi:hypothetical protein